MPEDAVPGRAVASDRQPADHAEPAADPGGGDGKKSPVRHDKETPEAEIKNERE